MAYDGDSGMTPLFKVIGFNVGKTIRGMFRALGRERDVIRIRVKSLSTRPAVDVPLIVNPLPAQQFVIAPTAAPPFSIDAIAVSPFAVRPTLLDSRALELLLPPGMPSADIAELSQAPLVGAVAGELGVDDELTVRPIDDTPAIIEPVDSEPFLVNLMPAEELNFDVSTVSVYDERPSAGVPTMMTILSASTTLTSTPNSSRLLMDSNSTDTECGAARHLLGR